MSARYNFISVPIEDVIKSASAAFNSISDVEINATPVLDYVLPTVFLRCTGFMEQKLRTIHWSLGNVTMGLRYKIMKGLSNFGEYSSYKDKNDFYKLLRGNKSGNVIYDKVVELKDEEKRDMVDDIGIAMDSLFARSFLTEIKGKDYRSAKAFIGDLKAGCFATDSLLKKDLEKNYAELYLQRNRLAHNLMAHQQDSVSLDNIANKLSLRCNYFTYFAILILMDRVFQKMYEKRIATLEN